MAINKRKILESAQKHLQKGALDRALKDYQQLVDANPRDANSRLKIGDIQLRRGKREEAIAAYLKVAEQFMQEGFDAKAVAIYKQVAKIDPKRYEVQIPLAELYQRLGLTSEAMNALQTAADVYNREGRKREALELLRKMATLDPSNTTSRLKIADLLRQSELPDEAIAEYREVAAELERQGEPERVVGVYERILEIDPDSVLTRVQLARARLRAGDLPGARRELDLALEREPDSIPAHELRLEVHRAEGDEDAAAETGHRLALLYRQHGDLDRAREMLQRLPPHLLQAYEEEAGKLPVGEVPEELSPPSPEETSLSGEDRLLADAAFGEAGDDAAIGFEPDQLVAEARVYARFGKRDRAVQTLETVLAQDPDHLATLALLGELLQEAGEAARAAEVLRRALAVARESGENTLVAGLGARLAELDPGAAELVQGAVDAPASEPAHVRGTGEPEADAEERPEPADAGAGAGGASGAAPASQTGELEIEIELESELAEVLDDALAAEEGAQPPADAAVAPTEGTGVTEPRALEDSAASAAEGLGAGRVSDEDLELSDLLDEALGAAEPAEPVAPAEPTPAREGEPAVAGEPGGAPPADASSLEASAEPAPLDRGGEDAVAEATPEPAAAPGPGAAEALPSLEEEARALERMLEDEPEAPASPGGDAGRDTLGATIAGQIAEDLEEAAFYFEQGLHEEAEAVYRRILEAAPGHPQALLRLGEIAAARGEQPPPPVPTPAPEVETPAAETPEEDFELELDEVLTGELEPQWGADGVEADALPAADGGCPEADGEEIEGEGAPGTGADAARLERTAPTTPSLECDAEDATPEASDRIRPAAEGELLAAEDAFELAAEDASPAGAHPEAEIEAPLVPAAGDLEPIAEAEFPGAEEEASEPFGEVPPVQEVAAEGEVGPPIACEQAEPGLGAGEPAGEIAGPAAAEAVEAGPEEESEELAAAEPVEGAPVVEGAELEGEPVSEEGEDLPLAEDLELVEEPIGPPEPGAAGAEGSASPDDRLTAIFHEFKRGVSETLGQGDLETRYDLGIAYREMGLLEDALGEFRLAMELPERRLDCLHLMGLCALDLGRPADATELLQQALSEGDLAAPLRVALLTDLGRAFHAAGDLERAGAAFRSALEIDPEHGPARALFDALGCEPVEGPGVGGEAFESFDDLLADVAAMSEPSGDSASGPEPAAGTGAGEEPPPAPPGPGGAGGRRGRRRRKISFG